MSDIRLTSDVVNLDLALMNSYSEHVLPGKSLNIQYGTYITMLQMIAGGSVSVNASRAVSRLKAICCSFDDSYAPSAAAKVAFPYTLVKKNWNSFYHPMADGRKYDFKKELEYQIQIGSKQIPEYPCRGISQSHSELKKALGILGSPWHSISPSFSQYCKDKYIIGVDCEKVLDASWSGLNLSLIHI